VLVSLRNLIKWRTKKQNQLRWERCIVEEMLTHTTLAAQRCETIPEADFIRKLAAMQRSPGRAQHRKAWMSSSNEHGETRL
jgi:hypothetical protein